MDAASWLLDYFFTEEDDFTATDINYSEHSPHSEEDSHLNDSVQTQQDEGENGSSVKGGSPHDSELWVIISYNLIIMHRFKFSALL